MAKETKIIDFFWQALGQASPLPEYGVVVTEETWQTLWDHGFLSKQATTAQWRQAWESLATEGPNRRVTPEDLKRFYGMLYQGPIKTPFQPKTLPEGTRPQAWLAALYQKVLRFETTLTPVEWQKRTQTEILPRFSDESGEFIEIQTAFKNYLQDILEQSPSPLRKLELWVSKGCPSLANKPSSTPSEKQKAPTKEPSKAITPPTRDAFQKSSPDETHIRQVEKSYYQVENKPPQDDQETLEFLDSLEEWEDEGDDET